jgi:hypothetical protein
VHHADHGCQDTSLVFGRRLTEAGLVASMATVGDALDNAVAESFLATLECELLDRHAWPTRAGLGTAVFDFIESSPTVNAATPPSATSHPSATSSSTHHSTCRIANLSTTAGQLQFKPCRAHHIEPQVRRGLRTRPLPFVVGRWVVGSNWAAIATEPAG